MRITRHRQAKTFHEPKLTCRRVEQIGAAHHGVDALSRIVYDNGKLIGILPVGTQQNEVTNVVLKILTKIALDTVAENEFTVGNS